jgi:hypothetical protein
MHVEGVRGEDSERRSFNQGGGNKRHAVRRPIYNKRRYAVRRPI